MARYALLDAQSRIAGVAEWDGVAPWRPPEGLTAVPEADALAKGLQGVPASQSAVRTIEPRAFMSRLSLATQRGIQAAALGNADLALLLTRLNGGDVDLDSAETRQGIATMQAAGLITAADAAALVA